jgi:hypothetical protein
MTYQLTETRKICSHVLATASLAIAAMLAVSIAHGGSLIYKWIDSQGVVSYSQTHPGAASAHDVQTIEIESLPIDQQRAANAMLSDLRRRSELQTAEIQARLKSEDLRISNAIDALERAEAELASGSPPAADDRIGTAGGAARLNEQYFERVALLRANVEQARKSLAEAYAARSNR